MADSKDDDKKVTIEFAPGAFDNFDGTQEELDEMVAELTRMVEDGTLLEESKPLDLEELFEEDPEMALKLANDLGLFKGLVDELGNDVSFEEIQEIMQAERKSKLN